MRYIFQDHVLDIGRRELCRNGAAIPVTRQVFDLLEYLIRNRERVVGKEELIAAIWAGRAITDSALTTRINAARRAIGDNGERQHLIRTAPRKGYRFVADAIAEDASGDIVPPEFASPPAKRGPSRRDRPSIAVWPFTYDPERRGHAFLAGGIAEDLLTELTRLHWLHVLARDPGFDVQNGTSGVRYGLRGSVREAGLRVRVTAMLIDMDTGVLVWSGRQDRNSARIVSAHDDIVAAMVAAVGIAIVDAERHRALREEPDRLAAWEAYQRGMWHMSRCEPMENAAAQGFFQRSIDLDPNHAAAHGALGWSHMMAASIYSQMTIAEGCALAEPLVRKATALDENDVEARARMAIAAMLRGDLEGAFEDAQRVLSVNANCAEALGVKGTALLYSGRRQEGRAAIQRHLALSPRDPARPIRLSQIAASLYLDGAYGGALAAATRVVRQFPRHPTAYRWVAASLGQLGRAAEARDALRDLRTISPASFEMYVRQRPRYCDIEYLPMMEGLRKAGWRD